ncbi:hypothetical protein Ae406Ps2_6070 [Pseudonocardia sp. Ae406_Ps2]|nr:hypothetical protein Ae406Ps2_6070 [Pseudonocardia sp. Ae406_Ps2]
MSLLLRIRACPADHGTGSRSQILIEATSTVPGMSTSGAISSKGSPTCAGRGVAISVDEI